MSHPGVKETFVRVGGEQVRVWEKGSGAPLGVLAGLGGLNAWTPFLDELAQSRTVIVLSLPGFPGGGLLHKKLDTFADWIICMLDLLEAAGLEGKDLVGHSIGGMLAAEVAAFSRASVKSLVLIAPLGLYDEKDPPADPFNRRANELPPLLSTKPAEFAKERLTPPAGLSGDEQTEWTIVQIRATEAASRLLWPLGDLGLARRLHRVTCPVKLVWGAGDRVVPPSYAQKFASGLAGPTQIQIVPGAGHALDFDAPRTAVLG
ncbi:MAG TPA: alpha/beta fold hydrolase [Myxococcota bacterium]|nr:alpha/beta fold hydrolase [Myxococcota bacterium]